MTRTLALALAVVSLALGSAAAGPPAGGPADGATAPAAGSAGTVSGDSAGNATGDGLLREVRENRARLMDSQIDVPPPSAPSVDLEEAMRRLREALERPIAKPRPAEPTEAATTPAADGAGEAPPRAATQASPVLTEEELTRVKDLSLDRLGEPMGLADALFLGGHPAEAAALYERLLADGSLGAMARAWVLYQAANCKRQSDAAAALALYDRLLTEHPESPWVEAAKVRKNLLQWQTQTQPQTLLAPLPGAAATNAAASNAVTKPTEGVSP